MHWINAVAMSLMIMSGWQVTTPRPLFDPQGSHSITLGGWLGGALLWHFRGDVAVDGQRSHLSHVGLATGRFNKKLLPITPAGVISDARAALTGKLSHEDLSRYNQVQKLLYAGVVVVGIEQFLHLIVSAGVAVRQLAVEAALASEIAPSRV